MAWSLCCYSALKKYPQNFFLPFFSSLHTDVIAAAYTTGKNFTPKSITTEQVFKTDTVIDVSSLDKKTANQPCLSPKCCIFRTPSILARHKPEAYTPSCFSFGPFHHCRSPNLEASEVIKLKYLQDLLNRSHDPTAMLDECLISVKEVEGEARECYAEKLDLPGEKFAEMLLIDGCFIIELFRKGCNVAGREKDDPVFSKSCMLQFLYHDLILLEKQIPWCVLENLFKKTKDPSETVSLVKLAFPYFSHMFPYINIEKSIRPFLDELKPKHIIDLLWRCLVLPSETVDRCEKGKYLAWLPFPSATKLMEAGVTFVRAKEAKSILDIKWGEGRGGVLEIPSLLIQETTDTIFRNLISYEQCLPNCPSIFTSYARVMDNLIDTQYDMEILCNKNDVFDNWLSPEDGTQFFNRLYNDTYVVEFYGDLCGKVNAYCKKPWPKWRAALVHNYLNKPWAIVAVIYAFIMLVLTGLPIVLK